MSYQLPVVSLPRAVPPVAMRPPQEDIPQTRSEREVMLRQVQDDVAARRSEITPPLVMGELQARSDEILRAHASTPGTATTSA